MSSRSFSSPLKSVSLNSSSWYSSVSGLFIVFYIYLVPISSAPSFILSISSSAIPCGASSSSGMDYKFFSAAGYLAASSNFFASFFIYFIFF